MLKNSFCYLYLNSSLILWYVLLEYAGKAELKKYMKIEKLQRESEFFKDSIHKSGRNNAHEYL